MPSRFDTIAADEFDRCFSEFKETVIRRIGGSPERTEDVEAVVSLDDAGGGLVSDGRGQMVEFGGTMEIPATQASTAFDHWVIGGELYHQIGEATGKDGGSQTVVFTKRKGHTSREPRVRQ